MDGQNCYVRFIDPLGRDTSVVRHARAITFQLAEVAVSGDLFNRILAAIQRLHAPPAPA